MLEIYVVFLSPRGLKNLAIWPKPLNYLIKIVIYSAFYFGFNVFMNETPLKLEILEKEDTYFIFQLCLKIPDFLYWCGLFGNHCLGAKFLVVNPSPNA